MGNTSQKAWAVRIAIGLAALGAAFGIFEALKGFIGHTDQPKQIVHNISLIKQPPPPPPKPPDKPPEPPKIKEEVKIQQDQPKPADKAPDEKPASDKPLAVDAQGGAGSDNFGLAGRIGGKDLLATGGGGAYYTGLLQRQFYEALQRNKKIQHQEYRVVVKVILASDGRVEKASILTGSGNNELDEQIQAALADLPPLKEVPPTSLREVEVRLTNRT